MAAETKNTKALYNTEIPGDWEVKYLGKVARITSGGTPRREKKAYWGGNIPWVTTSLIDFNEIFSTEEHITVEGLNNSSAKLFPKGTLLMALYGQGVTRGKTAILEIEATTNQACAAILLDETQVDRKFIFQYLISKYDDIRKLSNTGNQENLNGELVKSIRLNIPPLPEQKAIAQVLSTADAAIHTTEKLIAQKELRKKWLMQQLLSEKGIVKNEKWCKSGVREVYLKDIAKVTMGQSPNSEDYNTDEDGLPLIQGNADLTDRKQVVRYWTSQSNKVCNAGDIIMTVRAPVGAIGIASHNSSIGRGVCSIKPKSVDYWYLYHILVYKEEQWKKLEQGSTFTAVGSKDIFHFPLFIVHSLEEQTAIAQVLQAADKEIEKLKMKSEKLRELKKGMMQVLLTGKVRLKIENK